MKKIVISLMVSSAILSAKPAHYKIFAETYSGAQTPEINKVFENLKKELSDIDDMKVVKRSSGNWYVIVVEGNVEENRAHEILNRVRAMPEHNDAFVTTGYSKFKLVEPEVTKEVVNEYIAPVVDNQEYVAPEIIEQVPTNALSLQEVVQNMLVTNPRIQEDISNYIQVGKDTKIAKSGFYPKLDLEAAYGYEKVRADKSDWKNGTRKEASLTLVENIYNGGADSNRIKQEKSRLDGASFLVVERADRLSLQMSEVYLRSIKERELLKLSEENVAIHKEIYSQIKDRVDSGFGRMSEEKQAGSRLTLAESNLIAQSNNYHDSLSSFEKLYGQPIDASSLYNPEFTYQIPSNQEEVLQKAYLCNPSIKVQEANIKLANLQKDGVNAKFLPKLDAVGKVSYSDDVQANDQRNDSYSALLRLSYNLYNGGADSLEKEKKQVLIQKETQSLSNLKRDLQESLRFSWQSYISNQNKLVALQDHVKFSYATLSAYREEFKIGKRDLINLLDAENEYFSARKELISTEYALNYSKYRLMDNMGLISDSFDSGFGKKYIKSACGI